jgi:hypothetical protein
MLANGTEDRSEKRSTAELLGVLVLLVAVFGVLALALSMASSPGAARFPIDNFTNVDDTATATPRGQNVAISGWVKCTEGHMTEIRVTVTQGSTEAEGSTRVRCLGQSEVQTWVVHVTSRGPETFDVGSSVQVDAWAVTRSRGEQTDGPHTWSNDDVTLIRR